MAGDSPRGAAAFPKTGWSTVGQAAGEDDAGREALDRLLRRYVRPLQCHLVGSMRIPADDAADLLQGFITDKIIAGRLLAAADRDRGRFRALLKTALENYVRSVERRGSTRRRRPTTGVFVSLSDCVEPLAPGVPVVDSFEIAWAREVLAEALRRTEAHYREGGRKEVWLAFERRVVGPAFRGERRPSCADLAACLKLDSAQAVSNAVVTCGRALRRHLQAVVREYAADETTVDAEVSELREILGRSGQYPPRDCV
jgi:hypothetical protein